MKLFKFLPVVILALLLAACSGKSGEQQQAEEGAAEPTESATADDVRTIELVGIDVMKFGVRQPEEGITVGDTIGKQNDLLLLESIEAEPGEQIRIRLYTRSQLPATAMAHNWILLNLDANTQDFVNAAIQARDNEYIPANMTDQIYAMTGLAAGDETVEVTFEAPSEPGKYEFICSFPGHYAAGMKGWLVVGGSDDDEMQTED